MPCWIKLFIVCSYMLGPKIVYFSLTHPQDDGIEICFFFMSHKKRFYVRKLVAQMVATWVTNRIVENHPYERPWKFVFLILNSFQKNISHKTQFILFFFSIFMNYICKVFIQTVNNNLRDFKRSTSLVRRIFELWYHERESFLGAVCFSLLCAHQ